MIKKKNQNLPQNGHPKRGPKTPRRRKKSKLDGGRKSLAKTIERPFCAFSKNQKKYLFLYYSGTLGKNRFSQFLTNRTRSKNPFFDPLSVPGPGPFWTNFGRILGPILDVFWVHFRELSTVSVIFSLFLVCYGRNWKQRLFLLLT